MSIDPLEILIHIINLVVLFVILRFLLYKPVRRFMAERTQRIGAQLEQAEKREAEAGEAKERYDGLVAGSEKAAEEKLTEILRKANADAGELLDKANEQARAVVAGAHEQAELEKKNVLSGMRGEIADVSVEIAGKILAREVTLSDNQKIVDSFFEGQG